MVHNIDRKLLNIIQNDFPIDKKPFYKIAKKLKLSEENVICRIKKLKKDGYIRNISAIFEAKKMGYKSTLVCAKVKKDKLEKVAKKISGNKYVSHNYERNHEFNLWFTLTIPKSENFQKIINKYKKDVLEIQLLPAKKTYKIGVMLNMTNEKIKIKKKKRILKTLRITHKDKLVIKELQKDLKIISEPFISLAKNAKLSTDEFVKRTNEYLKAGTMRRYAAILKHRKAGFSHNAMIAWNVSNRSIEKISKKFIEIKEVSHCYLRPKFKNWPYSLYTMIHSRSKSECENLIKSMSKMSSLKSFAILYSTREFKKKRVMYFY